MKKQKTKKKQNNKGIIITGVVVALIMLILLTADGIKNMQKNNTPIGLSEQQEQEEQITNTPNAPTMSAGMIPVKYDGDSLKICKNDNTWYNYNEGKPAYMMLNDGVYQSELVVDMTNKKLASENIGQVVQPNEQGSIYMWIPRFAINTETEEIVYVEQEKMVAGKYNQQATFTYETDNMDFSLAGIWIEKEPLTNASRVNTKVANMNKEDNIYGLIANTVGVAMAEDGDCPITAELWLTGTAPEGIADWANTNRTIIKIIDTNKLEPIKAKAYYDETEEKIKIKVTYNKSNIAKIEDKSGNILSTNSNTADTGEELIGNGTYKYIVTDNVGNKREIVLKITGLNIYIIPDLETLKEFRDEANAGNNFYGITVIQTADIEMNNGKYTIDEETKEITFADDAEKWIPIGAYETGTSFRGTYDGRGHIISGLYINESKYCQGLFGSAGNSSVIKNLSIEKSKIIGDNVVGAIVGETYGNIENCSNSADIYSPSDTVGGICGEISSKNAKILNCSNTGNVTSTVGYDVGGICGRAYNVMEIVNCYNTGNIIVSSIAEGIGGICGSLYNGTEIKNCYNIGSVTANSSRCVGGILGSNDNTVNLKITNCYNIGNVTGKIYSAGICGRIKESAKIDNCYNIGEIASNDSYGGGILGSHVSSGTKITNCYNKGNISSTSTQSGGICGALGSRIRIVSCYNTGNIMAKGNYAGGIGAYDSAGITGGTQDSWFTMNTCYNAGEVTAANYPGGILGRYSGNSYETFFKNYNLGKVTASGKYAGGIIGQISIENNTDCYYETGTADYGIGSKSSDSGCTKTTREEILSQILSLEEYKNDIGINNGLPILSWQTDNDKLNLINGDNVFVEDSEGINNGYPIFAWQVK